MKIEMVLRFENDEVDNTWFSNAEEPPFQLHFSRELYIAMGRPQKVKVTVEPQVYRAVIS
jgi:hypothetical protein